MPKKAPSLPPLSLPLRRRDSAGYIKPIAKPSTPRQASSIPGRAQIIKITDNLFVGNRYASHEACLKRHKIKHVIDISGLEESHDYPDINYLRIMGVRDALESDLKQHLERTYKFVANAVENDEVVLVHCFAGQGRSPSVVIAYLMQANRWTFDSAEEFVQEKRPSINVIRFEEQLREWQHDLGIESQASVCTQTTTTVPAEDPEMSEGELLAILSLKSPRTVTANYHAKRSASTTPGERFASESPLLRFGFHSLHTTPTASPGAGAAKKPFPQSLHLNLEELDINATPQQCHTPTRSS